uniref:Aminoadipate-semialdehyde dehydrogenase n=1 Tax=Paramormyrops kingsleyae TaxID=1676925 RepID=A0A3B3S6E3_9TELE
EYSAPSAWRCRAGLVGLAYVLHTSGTTGLPKAVKVPHQCIVPNITHLRSLFQITASDVIFMASPLTFDPSVVEIFLALSSGACLLIVPTLIKRIPSKLVNVLFTNHKTTVLQATPTLLARFGRNILQGVLLSEASPLRVLALGGEACPPLSLLRSWRQQGNATRVFNLYGITEVSCWASCYEIPASQLATTTTTDGSSVHLGTPLMGTTMEVKDERGCVVTEGEGQVFVWLSGGERRVCYLGDETEVVPGTMRRTGDWVEVKNSHLYFVGRRDRLVKRHGQQVHLDAVQRVSYSRGHLTPFPRDLQREILHSLSKLLPSQGVPDTLIPLRMLPTSTHGTPSLCPFWGLTCASLTLTTFLLSGGDSLQCLRLCDDVASSVGVAPAALLEVLLSGSFSDVVSHVATALFPFENSEITEPTTKGLPNEMPLSRLATKESSKKPSTDSQRETLTSRKDLHLQTTERSDAGAPLLNLHVRWTSDTGRCVDASPVLLVTINDHTSVMVYIGSHSHRFQAVDFSTGDLRWERVLGGRIESSAVVSRCGHFIAVGCYDGQVYFLCADTGGTHWVFSTGDAVKSCPAVDMLTGWVVIGSHDGCVYALDLEARHCIWTHPCGGGGVFSSPCFHPSLRQLYVATLGGRLLSLNADTGAPLWMHSSEKPFFSSPRCCHSHVCIGSVDGNLYGFSHAGEKVWQFSTGGPIFSSPCPMLGTQTDVANQRVLCGSHDGCVYCVNGSDGTLVWRFQTGARVFSCPFAVNGSRWGCTSLVVVSSTDGTVWLLDGDDGALRASLQLPGELFSSPVLWQDSLVVGCRNDLVYCVDIIKQKELNTDSDSGGS